MQPKNLLILSGVTGLFAVGAMLALKTPDASASRRETRPLFEDLDQRVNDVARIELEQGDKKLTLQKSEGTWGLEERGGYPVLLSEVKKAATFVTGLEIEETKSDRAEHHERLGVPDPTGPDATSTRITLIDGGGATMGSIIASKTEFRGSSQKVFVRESGENQVYLCDGAMSLDLTPSRWIETGFLKLPGDRVTEVLITHADGEVVRVGRVEENPGQFELKNLPPDREEKYAGVTNPIGTALAALSLEDVRPVDEVDFTAEPVAEALFRTEDGLVLSLTTAKFEDKTWVRVRPAFEEPAQAPEPTAEEAEAPDTEAAREEAASLTSDLTPWAFAIPAYKSDSLARRLEDLLAELPEEEPLPVEEAPVDPAPPTEDPQADPVDPSDTTDTDPAPPAEDGR